MAFARRDYFYCNAAEQKYQNLFQLFFGPIIVCLAGIFHLQPNATSAENIEASWLHIKSSFQTAKAFRMY